MKKLLLLCQMLFGVFLMAQVSYTQNWTAAGLNGWATSGSVFSNNTTANQICGTTGGTIRGERYYGNAGQFTSPNLTGNSTGQVTMAFDYKVTDYSAGTAATPASNVGTISVEYASNTAGPWTVASVINSTNHTAANTCATKTITFVPSPGNLYVRFNVTSEANSDVYYYFDNVNISQTAAPTCLAPSNVTLVSSTATTANISWTAPAPAPALGYDVYYNTTGVAPTGATVLNGTNSVTSTTNTAVIPSLTPTTTYYVWVRAKCSATDQSFWISMQSFTTPCVAVTTLPWTENFDTMASIGSGIVPPCWKQVTGTNPWVSANTGSTTYNSPRSTPNYMQLNWSSTNPSQLWTPGFALTAGTTYEYSFYYNSGGTGSSYQGFTGTALVNTSQSMTGATTLGTFITATQAVGSYTLYKVYFAPTTSGTYYFGASASSTSSPWYLGLDDFKLRVAPSCLDPQGFTSTAVTATTATVTWTVPTPAPAGGYDIYYSTTNTTPAPTATPQNSGVTGPTQIIGPLATNTTYYVWIRAKCSATNIGEWTGPIQVTTVCSAITTLPWTENFDAMPSIGTGVVPSCWKNVTGTSAWISSNVGSTTYNSPRSTPNYMRQSYSNTTASQLWTPGFVLTAGITYEYSFYYNSGGTGSSYQGFTGTALVNTQQSITGASTLGTFITATQAVANYTLYKVYYTPAANGTYYFGTNVSSTSAPWYLGLDDFKLRVAPSCLDPQNFVVTNTTTTSTTVQWTVPTPAPANGYDIYYTTTAGVPLPTVTPQYTGVAGPSQLISPLTPSTTYYIWIRAKCSATSIGDWVGPLQVYTNYCVPTQGSSTSYFIKDIVTTGGLANVTYNATTYAAYVNNSALPGITLTPTQTVSINVNPSTGSSHQFYIWVDKNNNMVFEATEAILTTTYQANVSAYQLLGSSLPIGTYRMRFSSSWSGSITPCGVNNYGNYVDYTLKIIPCSTAAPTNVFVDTITNVSAIVHWTPGSSDNLNYIVYWREVGTGPGWANSAPVAAPATQYQILTGLAETKNYEAKVVAICGTTEGTGTIVPFSTTCDPAPPFVSVTQITATSAMVSWNPTLNAIFALQYRKVGSATWLPAPPPANSYIPVTGTSYMLGVPPGTPALEPFTKYEVRVANRCVAAPNVVNTWSTPAVFTTLRTCPMPVPGLTVTYMTTTTAQVQWDAFPGATYVLRYKKVGFPSWTEVTSTVNNLTLTGLIEDTKYEMQVVNVCSGVRGSWSDPYYFTTPTIVYCQMASGSAGNVFISGVVVKNSLGAEMKNDATNIATTYSNFTTDATKVVNLIQGSTGNQLTVTKKWAGTIENAGLAAWIDFNRDGIFQPTERIMVSQASKNTPITATFDVPSDAYVSMTDYKYVIMRVAVSKNEVPVNCVSMAEGEVEDYLVKITKTPIPSGIDPNEIVIYPNPVTTILYVKNMEDRSTYKIYNAAGQLLKSGLILSGKVDVSGLIKGVYVIDLQDSKNNVQKKFIKN